MPIAHEHEIVSARRVLFYGVTGSGKSTLAREFAQLRHYPLCLVDEQIGFVPASEAVWQNRDENEMRALADQFTQLPEWVCDSAWGKFKDVIFSRADLLVALDYPRYVSLWRLIKRSIKRVIRREHVCNGNIETWRRLFNSESIIRWHFLSFSRKRQWMREQENRSTGIPVVRLTSPSAAEAFLAAVRVSVTDR